MFYWWEHDTSVNNGLLLLLNYVVLMALWKIDVHSLIKVFIIIIIIIILHVVSMDYTYNEGRYNWCVRTDL